MDRKYYFIFCKKLNLLAQTCVFNLDLILITSASWRGADIWWNKLFKFLLTLKATEKCHSLSKLSKSDSFLACISKQLFYFSIYTFFYKINDHKLNRSVVYMFFKIKTEEHCLHQKLKIIISFTNIKLSEKHLIQIE